MPPVVMERAARRPLSAHAGQALVPALLFLLIGGIGLYVAFGSFQMTSAKIKLQNTADAAAYSAAVLQARDYNFSAYTNRAMVANQVSAAQVVALKSWIDELDNTYIGNPDTEQLVTTFADHPALWRTPNDRARIDIAPVRAALDALLPVVAKGVGGITRALSTAQTNYHAAMFAAVPDAADDVAQRNQPDTHVTAGYFTSPRNAAQLAAWRTYTAIVTPTGNLNADRFADVVTDPITLDGFVKQRVSSRSVAPDYQQIDDTSSRCGNGGRIAIRVAHVGGTQLRSDKKGWQSIDASTAHIAITCVDTFDAIAGHGGSTNGNVRSYMTRPPFVAWSDWKGYGGYMNFGDPASTQPGVHVPDAMAEQFTQGPGVSLDAANGGLLPYQDMAGAPLASEAPRITIEVERAAGTLVKTAGLGGAGRMRVDNGSASGTMRALASAHAYFVRPSEAPLSDRLAGALLDANAWARADGNTEYPSTFSPYWQASLAPVGDAERAAAQAVQIASDAEAAQP
jgi:Flp pilus assembly protein TadG